MSERLKMLGRLEELRLTAERLTMEIEDCRKTLRELLVPVESPRRIRREADLLQGGPVRGGGGSLPGGRLPHGGHPEGTGRRGVNHRELMLSKARKCRSTFLQLPEAIQDEVIDGLDSGSINTEEAVQLLQSRGFKLCRHVISEYYRAVRRERRLLDASRNLERIVEGFARQPYEETLKGLTNLIVAMAALGLAEGTIGIKDIDLPRVLGTLCRNPPEGEGAHKRKGPADDGGPKGLSDATVSEIRRKILGCKS